MKGATNMGLREYQRKRHFQRTPEPRGKKAAKKGMSFVVQKHAASHLHYDFRLELDGVLKSWAVPKGPSRDRMDKRLAIQVEDHPLEYADFEGTIPAGNYGAGEVLVWDEGVYRVPGATNRKQSEARMRAGLARGRVSLTLEGQKLKGEFALFKVARGQKNAWLLVKKRDRFASDRDVTAEERSVASGRTLEDIAHNGQIGKRSRRPKDRPASDHTDGSPPSFFHTVKPMLATLVDKPFSRYGWLFEVKWDGYRAIAEVGRHGVHLYSRNQKSFNARFRPVVNSLSTLDHEAVFDGEVVVVDNEGKSHFQLLQNYQRTGRGRLVYYVFDLLYLDGNDLRQLPLTRRKELLAEILDDLPDVRFSDHVEDQGTEFFDAAVAAGLEGIIAKNGASPYREGIR